MTPSEKHDDQLRYMDKHRTYRSRGRVYCADSGTVPHPSDMRGELVRGQFNRAWCPCCEREVALLRNGGLSHHGPNPKRKLSQP